MPRPRDNDELILTSIVGRVIRDPEETEYGDNTVVNFTVAVPLTYGDRDDPNDFGTSRFYSVGVWKEDLQQYVWDNIHKGSNVVVEGAMRKVERGDAEYRNLTAFRLGTAEWFTRERPKARKSSGRTTRTSRRPVDEEEDL